MRKPGERSARTVIEPAREHDPRPRSRTTVLTALQRGAGNRAVAGLLSPPLLSPSAGPAVQRFGSREHRQIGDTVAAGTVGSGQTTSPRSTSLRYGDGPTEVLTYGEVVALSGDYFGSLAEMETLAADPAGREQIRYARWKALYGGQEPEPGVSPAARTAVNNRYFNLAARNVSHFSAGGTAGSTYEEGHRVALRRAFLAGLHGNADEFQAAMTAEAACQHYLTDMFSGGHVRTPRQDIRQWYGANYGDSPNRLKTLLVGRLITHLNQLDHDQLQNIPDMFIRPKVERILEDMAGPALRAFSLGDIVSLALHNDDNAHGVPVTSAVDASGNPSGTPWVAYGDGNLNEPAAAGTLAMVTAAARASIAEVERLRQAGAAQAGGAAAGTRAGGMTEPAMADVEIGALGPFRALSYVPHAVSGAPTVATPPWQWGSFTAEIRRAVDETVRGEIGGTVANVARRGRRRRSRAQRRRLADRDHPPARPGRGGAGRDRTAAARPRGHRRGDRRRPGRRTRCRRTGVAITAAA
jgi:hypothetical protein